VIVRAAAEADVAAIAEIYGHHVMHGAGTFEETPPSLEEIARRVDAVTALGLPYLVAEGAENAPGVIGFAYAAPFRPRAAYRFTAEDSVYVAPAAARAGVGSALLGRVIGECEALGLRQMMAVIGDADNAASIGLHRALGFAPAGVCRAVGFKHGRWLDTVWMQRPLNGGDADLPTRPGLRLSGG
jgi:phosphinothricin acetyltransferase